MPHPFHLRHIHHDHAFTSSTLRELCLFVWVLSANDRTWSIIALTFWGLFLITFHCKQIIFMDVFVQNTYMLFCTCSAFPSSKIPNKTFCSLSNCCFSFPFFSSRSSSLNDLNVLGIFSQDFLQQFICCKRSEHYCYPGYWFHSFCRLALNVH